MRHLALIDKMDHNEKIWRHFLIELPAGDNRIVIADTIVELTATIAGFERYTPTGPHTAHRRHPLFVQ